MSEAGEDVRSRNQGIETGDNRHDCDCENGCENKNGVCAGYENDGEVSEISHAG